MRAELNPKSGELRLFRHLLVVEQVENPAIQITLEEARRHNPAAQVGDTIADTLPPLEYGRIAAQSAKQVIVQKVREAERDRQYQEFKDRIGDIVNGIVKRVDRRSSFRAHIRSSWPSCSPRRCRKSMTASWR